jgi:hypothetical protein
MNRDLKCSDKDVYLFLHTTVPLLFEMKFDGPEQSWRDKTDETRTTLFNFPLPPFLFYFC